MASHVVILYHFVSSHSRETLTRKSPKAWRDRLANASFKPDPGQALATKPSGSSSSSSSSGLNQPATAKVPACPPVPETSVAKAAAAATAPAMAPAKPATAPSVPATAPAEPATAPAQPASRAAADLIAGPSLHDLIRERPESKDFECIIEIDNDEFLHKLFRSKAAANQWFIAMQAARQKPQFKSQLGQLRKSAKGEQSLAQAIDLAGQSLAFADIGSEVDLGDEDITKRFLSGPEVVDMQNVMPKSSAGICLPKGLVNRLVNLGSGSDIVIFDI